MSMKDANNIVTHLQFAGYETMIDGDTVFAKHASRLNFFVDLSLSTGFRFSSYFKASDFARSDRLGFYDLVNSLNMKAMVAQFVVDSDGDLLISSFSLEDYDRQRFARFLDIWHADVGLLFDNKNLVARYLR